MWDQAALRKMVHDNKRPFDQNSVYEYSKFMRSLTGQAKQNLLALFSKVFWEEYPTEELALSAPIDVLFEVLQAMWLGSIHNTKLLTTIKNLVLADKSEPLYGEILSNIMGSKNPEAKILLAKYHAAQLEIQIDLLKKSINLPDIVDLKKRTQVHTKMCEVLGVIFPDQDAGNKSLIKQFLAQVQKQVVIAGAKTQHGQVDRALFQIAVISLEYQLFHAKSPNPLIDLLINQATIEALPFDFLEILLTCLRTSLKDIPVNECAAIALVQIGAAIWFISEFTQPGTLISLDNTTKKNLNKHQDLIYLLLTKVQETYLLALQSTLASSQEIPDKIIDLLLTGKSYKLLYAALREMLPSGKLLKQLAQQEIFLGHVHEALNRVKHRAVNGLITVEQSRYSHKVLANFEYLELGKLNVIVEELLRFLPLKAAISNDVEFINIAKLLAAKIPVKNIMDFDRLCTCALSFVFLYKELDKEGRVDSQVSQSIRKIIVHHNDLRFFLDKFQDYYFETYFMTPLMACIDRPNAHEALYDMLGRHLPYPQLEDTRNNQVLDRLLVDAMSTLLDHWLDTSDTAQRERFDNYYIFLLGFQHKIIPKLNPIIDALVQASDDALSAVPVSPELLLRVNTAITQSMLHYATAVTVLMITSAAIWQIKEGHASDRSVFKTHKDHLVAVIDQCKNQQIVLIQVCPNPGVTKPLINGLPVPEAKQKPSNSLVSKHGLAK